MSENFHIFKAEAIELGLTDYEQIRNYVREAQAEQHQRLLQTRELETKLKLEQQHLETKLKLEQQQLETKSNLEATELENKLKLQQQDADLKAKESAKKLEEIAIRLQLEQEQAASVVSKAFKLLL